MDRRIKIAHFGVGRMGRMITAYELDKGGEIVAAFDENPELLGKKLGEVIGVPEEAEIKIASFKEAKKILEETKPDICSISTKGTLAEMKETMKMCCEAGCNVITIGECAAWPWTMEAEIAKELDAIAKECGVTISAGGYPDTFWQNLVLTLAGAHEKLTKIHGTVTYNVEEYGPHFIVGHGVGLSLDEFEKKFAKEAETGEHGYGQSCMPGDPNGWIAHAMGLKIIRQTMQNVPRLSDEKVWCESYKRDIQPGEVLGTANVVKTETEEGIIIEMEVCGKIYAEGETDALTWEFEGEPSTKVIIPKPDTAKFTATSPVNRIPQVINAKPGYVTTDALPTAIYLSKAMNTYVNG